MKRSDLPTRALLDAISAHGFCAFEHLIKQYPVKVVRAAIARDVRTGRLEYGVSADRPWLGPRTREAD
ncbi:hypothetical protein [Streptomyces sp. NPDC093093]|uniref:hypothetical protein n=1 Tax=Streptomyces sp. NPDC093093 TaxID=3366025 RepID=UPI003825F2F5